jgi:hypothetical protein
VCPKLDAVKVEVLEIIVAVIIFARAKFIDAILKVT